MNKSFAIGEALKFEGKVYIPLNIIDLEYESPDDDSLLNPMNKETTGVGTRKAGKPSRIKALNLIDLSQVLQYTLIGKTSLLYPVALPTSFLENYVLK